MNKVWLVLVTLFTLPFFAVTGKQITDTITVNNTFGGYALATNLTQYAWIAAFTRSLWWFIPILVIVVVILKVMKREEPQQPSWASQLPTPVRVPRQPRQSKLKKSDKTVLPPSIFLGGGK